MPCTISRSILWCLHHSVLCLWCHDVHGRLIITASYTSTLQMCFVVLWLELLWVLRQMEIKMYVNLASLSVHFSRDLISWSILQVVALFDQCFNISGTVTRFKLLLYHTTQCVCFGPSCTRQSTRTVKNSIRTALLETLARTLRKYLLFRPCSLKKLFFDYIY